MPGGPAASALPAPACCPSSNQLKWRQFVLKALIVVILLLVIGGGLFVASMVSAPPVATVEKAIPHEVLVQ
jgi:formate/nitrite transporter FocA (FNT family)